MKKFRFLWVGSLMCIVLHPTIAQPKIQFEKTIHDFGQFVEGTVARYEFVFTNTGDQPLILANVAASCGCTTPFWTREPVLPGKKGIINVSYNSQGRPGIFSKTITIVANTVPQYTTLVIKGEAKRDQARFYSPEQLSASPRIAIEKTSVHLGKAEKGKPIPVSVKTLNLGVNDLRITGVRSSCNCVSWIHEGELVIKPGEAQYLQVVYRPQSLGERREDVIIFSNDLTKGQARLEIAATVVEKLDSQSIMKKDPVITF